MDRNNKEFKTLYKCIMANTSAIQQEAAYTTYQLSFLVCSTRATHKKPIYLAEKYPSFLLQKSWECAFSRKRMKGKEQLG